ncbi:MAG: 5'-nucleotidase C-terminal domain-containing protein [Firmicutes bacterium]|nr:5'-nucleotidase C-terminal domain-containing protein [Bacillota bacterium]
MHIYRKKDLLSVFPFGNTVSVVNVSGSELLELLEASTFSLPDKLAGYPQTAGIKFTVDCTVAYDAGELYPGTTYNRPNSIQRVTIESINGKPFDINKTYAIVTNDFLAAGGDTAYILGQKDNYETGKILDELLEEYITEELGGVLTAEKYPNSRGDHTLITEKTSDSTETTEEESKEETTAETTLKTTSEKKNRTSGKSSGGGRSSNAAVKKSAESPSENTSENAQNENDNYSATAKHKVSLTIGSTKIRLNNQEFDIPAAPYVSEDTNIVLVPLRFAAIAVNGLDIENADASEIVLWDAQAKTATVKANNMTVVFKADSSIMTLNGREVYMENDAAAQIKDGRMYIPYEAFGDALGIKTELDIQSGSVTFEK